MRIGTGFDIHKHNNELDLHLGTVKVDGPGFEGHSDGDIVVHALIDALLGTLSLGDIGEYFPSNQERWKDASGIDLLTEIRDLVYGKGLSVFNIDIIVISHVVRISDIKDKIIEALSELLGVNNNCISIKGKTTDHLGLIGGEDSSIALVTVLGKLN